MKRDENFLEQVYLDWGSVGFFILWGWFQELGTIEASKVVVALKVLKSEEHTKNVWKLYLLAYQAYKFLILYYEKTS